MNTGPTSLETGVDGQRAGSWLGRGFVASGRGIVLTGLILAEAAMLGALSLAVASAALGFGLLLIPGVVLAARALASTVRHLAGQWCDVPIGIPYRRPPRDEGNAGLWRRYQWLLTDPATWRDLLWMIVDCAAGWVLTLAPAALIGW